MGARGVVPQVHRGGIRRPQPRRQPRRRRRRIANFQPGRKRLPKILHADGESAAHIADKRQARRPPAGIRKDPGALRVGALVDREALGRGLRQFVVAPDRVLFLGILGVKPPAVEPLARRLGDIAAARLDRLGPQTARRARETHVPIVGLLPQRHREGQSDPANKILLLLAVEHERVHDADRLLSRIKIQPHGKRQPRTRAAHRLVHPFQFDHRADRAGLLNRHLADVAQKLLAGRRGAFVHVGTVLHDTHELPRPRDLATTDGQRLDQIRPGRPQARLHCPGVDVDCPVALPQRHRRPRRAGARFGRDGKRPRHPGSDRGGESAPLQRTVRPVGERPGLRRQRFALGVLEREGLPFFHGALRPRDPETHALGHARRGLVEPVDRHLGTHRRGSGAKDGSDQTKDAREWRHGEIG